MDPAGRDGHIGGFLTADGQGVADHHGGRVRRRLGHERDISPRSQTEMGSVLANRVPRRCPVSLSRTVQPVEPKEQLAAVRIHHRHDQSGRPTRGPVVSTLGSRRTASAARALNVLTPTTGTSRASANARAVATAILTPVNVPGPVPTTIAAISTGTAPI